MRSASRRFVKTLVLTLLAATARADVTVTQLANEGVILADGETRIMIDGFVVDTYSVYGGLPAEAAVLFNAGSGPFAGIDLALVSHRHHDHNQPAHACSFMQRSAATRLYTGSQVIGLMREKCRSFVTSSPRVREISPQYNAPEDLESKGARIRIFPLSHGSRKYAKIQNYGHLVELGGLTVLHVGDAAMAPTDFARAGLDKVALDVALIPFWYFQPGPGGTLIRDFIDARFKVAVHIPPGEMVEVKAYLQKDYPQVIVLEEPLDQAVFSAPPPPSE
jgi:L-ascorbate metabolism protein UlaG (beta-lactamase superfamily)